MSLPTALGVGLLLGARHAVDPDHLVVVTAMLERAPGRSGAVRTAILWGLGHSAAFLGVGLAIVALGLRIPLAFERLAEGLVAMMLVGLGTWQIAHLSARSAPKPDARGLGVRPVAAGLVHGLAGSAGVALLALTTIQSPSGALLYLAAFAAGTVAGMAISTTLLSWPLSLVRRAPPRVSRAVHGLAGAASVLLGLALLVGAMADLRP